MSTHTRSTPLSAALPAAIDGYDFGAETARAKTLLSEVRIAGHALHRASAQVKVAAEPPEWAAAREAHRAQLFPNTLDADSPVVELGWPTAGHYVMSSRGVEFDLM